jgi:hypothetical protein
MQRFTLLLVAQSLTASVLFAKLPQAEANRIVDAIYRVEGGAKAKVPFGILSVRVSSLEEARRVCYRTVQNNHDRWVRSGRRGEYLDFLADRYCPPSDDPKGNRNWKKNVRAFLSK